MLVIDVSNVQGHVDWPTVAKQHVSGAFLKASEGKTYQDAMFATHRVAAHKAGIHTAGYHFARPDHNSAADEAYNFASVIGKVFPGELRPVLDMETSPGLESWVRAFNAEVRKHLGVCPIFYSYPAFVSGMRLSKPLGCGLWLASYGRNDGVEHPFYVPVPWKRAVAHQFTSRGHVSGVSGEVDLSHVESLTPLLAHPVRGTVARLPYWAKRARVLF